MYNEQNTHLAWLVPNGSLHVTRVSSAGKQMAQKVQKGSLFDELPSFGLK